MKVTTLTVAVCSVDGCAKPRHSHGLCANHATKLKKYGDPTVSRQAGKGEALAWLREAIRQPGEQCTLWPFGKATSGYGVVWHEGESKIAPRVALILHSGEDPEEMVVAHGECHNRLCVNPLHLRWATRQENVADMERDATRLRGEKCAYAKLTEDDVREIRAMSASGVKGKEIAQQFGISYNYALRISRGEKRK